MGNANAAVLPDLQILTAFALLLKALPSLSEGDNVSASERYRDGLLLDLCRLLPSETVARIGENFRYALKESNNESVVRHEMGLPVR